MKFNYRRGVFRFYIVSSAFWILSTLAISHNALFQYFLLRSVANLETNSCPEDKSLPDEHRLRISNLDDATLEEDIRNEVDHIRRFIEQKNNPFREVLARVVCAKIEEAHSRHAAVANELPLLALFVFLPPIALFVVGTVIFWIALGFRRH